MSRSSPSRRARRAAREATETLDQMIDWSRTLGDDEVLAVALAAIGEMARRRGARPVAAWMKHRADALLLFTQPPGGSA